MDERYRHYLRDLGDLVREAAMEAAKEKGAARSRTDAAFDAGRRLAFYEVVSLMLSQAISLEIDPEDLGLSGFDPDRDILGGKG